MSTADFIIEIARLWNADIDVVRRAVKNVQEEMNLDYESASIRVLVEAERENAK